MTEKEKEKPFEIMKPTEYEEFALMERKDEEQILAELKGHYLDEFVYSFESAGRRITGLSWVGVKECAYRMGGIDVQSCIVEEKDRYWMVTVKAMDRATGSSRFGASTQMKKMKLRDGSEQDDMFALPKAMSKAQRNAIRALIPEAFIKTFIDRYLQEKRIARAKPIEREVSAEEISGLEATKREAPSVAPKPEVSAPEEWGEHPPPAPPEAKPTVIRHLIKWTVDQEDVPIPVDEPAYNSFVKNRVMKGLTEKHGIQFEEEVAGGYIFQIWSSDMDEKQFDGFVSALQWALSKIANVPKERIKIWCEK